MGKDRAAQVWAKQALAKCVKVKGDFVSAGELAKFMQVSRPTAAKRLRELHEIGEVEVQYQSRGLVTHVRYCPLSNKVSPQKQGMTHDERVTFRNAFNSDED